MANAVHAVLNNTDLALQLLQHLTTRDVARVSSAYNACSTLLHFGLSQHRLKHCLSLHGIADWTLMQQAAAACSALACAAKELPPRVLVVDSQAAKFFEACFTSGADSHGSVHEMRLCSWCIADVH
jgi:hypothetical protein